MPSASPMATEVERAVAARAEAKEAARVVVATAAATAAAATATCPRRHKCELSMRSSRLRS